MYNGVVHTASAPGSLNMSIMKVLFVCEFREEMLKSQIFTIPYATDAG